MLEAHITSVYWVKFFPLDFQAFSFLVRWDKQDNLGKGELNIRTSKAAFFVAPKQDGKLVSRLCEDLPQK